MVIVIDRQRAGHLILLFLLLVATGVFWSVAGLDSGRLVQTTVPVTPLPAHPPSAGEQNQVVPQSNAQLSAATGQPGKVEIRTPAPGLFDDYRMERDRARSTQIELLRSALADRAISDARREQLTNELVNLLKRGERELQAETLLKAKGYTDAVVVLGESGVNAVIPDVLDRTDASRVGELVSRATGVSVERITIIDGATRS